VAAYWPLIQQRILGLSAIHHKRRLTILCLLNSNPVHINDSLYTISPTESWLSSTLHQIQLSPSVNRYPALSIQ